MIQRYSPLNGMIEPDDDGDFVALDDVKPEIWFVKDFADGWIPFQDEELAKREAAETGALIMAGYRV